MDQFDRIQDTIEGKDIDIEDLSAFMSFEPFDIAERPQWVIDQAKHDDIDLEEQYILDHIGNAPHNFQTGYLLSVEAIRVLLAGTQDGKSITALIEIGIMATGQIPISMTVPAGVDTGFRRPISAENIRRWGRCDALSGKHIDNNVRARRDGSWHCGNIIGVGVYPKEKIAPPGSTIWVGTTAKSLLNFWWPKFTQKSKMMLPNGCIDTSKGNKGYNKTDNMVHIINDISIVVITYESGFDKYESEKAWAIIFDEEPPDERAWAAALTHSHFFSIVMTPYKGITYMEKKIFPDIKNENMRVFHCTAYDSPYKLQSDIDKERSSMKSWDIKARIWGLFSEIAGEPYFGDEGRTKLMIWMKQYGRKHSLVKFIPTAEYDKVMDILPIEVQYQIADKDDEREVWRMFEPVREGVAYVAGVDIAEGSETPEDAQDRNAVIIMRPPIRDEVQDETKPVIVATLRSTCKVTPFAHTTLHALRYYNNALLAAETQRGFFNGAFMTELKDWPFWLRMITTNDKTNKPQTKIGFDTNARTRNMIFEFIDNWISEFDIDQDPGLVDIDLMRELAAAVVGKNGRCDHTKKGSLDSVIAFGILLYVFKQTPYQVRCNSWEKERPQTFSRIRELLRNSGVTEPERDHNSLGSVFNK